MRGIRGWPFNSFQPRFEELWRAFRCSALLAVLFPLIGVGLAAPMSPGEMLIRQLNRDISREELNLTVSESMTQLLTQNQGSLCFERMESLSSLHAWVSHQRRWCGPCPGGEAGCAAQSNFTLQRVVARWCWGEPARGEVWQESDPSKGAPLPVHMEERLRALLGRELEDREGTPLRGTRTLPQVNTLFPRRDPERERADPVRHSFREARACRAWPYRGAISWMEAFGDLIELQREGHRLSFSARGEGGAGQASISRSLLDEGPRRPHAAQRGRLERLWGEATLSDQWVRHFKLDLRHRFPLSTAQIVAPVIAQTKFRFRRYEGEDLRALKEKLMRWLSLRGDEERSRARQGATQREGDSEAP
ncbi:MAG: hypothetical protein VYD19_10315 [Myxococcota bacterium]|nr:hypothetical protein [Myxococcota bacterium]